MKLPNAYRLLATCLLAFAWTGAPAAQLEPGKHYRLIDPPQPTASGKQVEVIEFFDYGCPHCNDLQPALRVWLKRKPADVDFRREHVVFRDGQLPLATTFHALDAMGILHQLHYELFSAIHEKRNLPIKVLLKDPKPLFDWVATQGVDRKQFADVYNSFGVRSRTNRSIQMTKNYDIRGTPTLAIDGKYLITLVSAVRPDNSVDYERFTQVLDQTITMARKDRAKR